MQQPLQVCLMQRMLRCCDCSKVLLWRKFVSNDNWCLSRYYVGVLNKRTMQMEVHKAQLFNMQPVIPGKNDCIPKVNDIFTQQQDLSLFKGNVEFGFTFGLFSFDQEKRQTLQSPRTLLSHTETRCHGFPCSPRSNKSRLGVNILTLC